MPFQDLALPKSIHDYVEARNQTIQMLNDAYTVIEQADQAFSQFYEWGLPCEAKPRDSLEETTKEIDRRLWRVAFDKTGLRQILDAQAKREFDRKLQDNPPAFSIENIRAEILALHQDADELFARGIVNTFRRLTSHKTNTDEPFKINRKAILSGMFTNWNPPLRVNYSSYSTEQLDDINRVFVTLDGKTFQPRSLEIAINAKFAECFKEGEAYVFENEYFQIKGYRNTNAHFLFKREDLLDKVNLIIAKWYGDRALAA